MREKFFMAMLAVGTSALAAEIPKIRADLNISDIVSIQTQNEVYRAIKGYNEIYPFLVIEKIQLPNAEGDSAVLSNSWSLSDMVGGKNLLPLKEGDDIREMKWRGHKLYFELYRESLERKCQVTSIAEAKPNLSCKPGRMKK